MRNIPLATEKAVIQYLLNCSIHSSAAEYWTPRLQIKNQDPQRPHDLEGEGNKLEYEVIQELSLQHMPRPYRFQKQIFEGREKHRIQDHHKKGNKPNPFATEEDIKFSVLDTILALGENRGYRKKDYSLLEMNEFMFPTHQRPYVKPIITQMLDITKPETNRITSIHEIPNIGMPEEMYKSIIQKMSETIEMLREKGYSLRR
jgi:hypothetical protein